jgi:hypothetical protein
MTHHHIRSIAIALVATAAIAAPAAAQDLRSPDAADPSARPAVANIDLRSPDAVDLSAKPAIANVDLRSPDAADPYSGIPVQVVEHAPVVSVREVASGFDWGDAGVGAGALLTLVLLIMGGSVFLKRHRTAFS